MSGSSSMMHGQSITGILLKKNSDLQAQVHDQLRFHEHLTQRNKDL